MVLNNWFFNNLIINFDDGVCVVVPIERSDDDLPREILSIYFIFMREKFPRGKNEPIFYTMKYDGLLRCIINLPFKFFISLGFDKSDEIIA